MKYQYGIIKRAALFFVEAAREIFYCIFIILYHIVTMFSKNKNQLLILLLSFCFGVCKGQDKAIDSLPILLVRDKEIMGMQLDINIHKDRYLRSDSSWINKDSSYLCFRYPICHLIQIEGPYNREADGSTHLVLIYHTEQCCCKNESIHQRSPYILP